MAKIGFINNGRLYAEKYCSVKNHKILLKPHFLLQSRKFGRHFKILLIFLGVRSLRLAKTFFLKLGGSHLRLVATKKF